MVEVIVASKGFVVGVFCCLFVCFPGRLSWHNLRTWACG